MIAVVALLDSCIVIAHLLTAHLAAAGPILAMVLAWRPLDEARRRDGQRIVQDSLTALLATAALGVILGLWRWSAGADYAAAWQVLGTRIRWGVAEYLFSLGLLIMYCRTYPRQQHESRASRWGNRILAMATATNLLYHFPLLLTTVANVAHGQFSEASLRAASVKQLLFTPETLAKTLHFALAALVTSAVWTVFRARSSQSQALAAGTGLIATLLQLFSGFWLLLTLDRSVQLALMGGRPWLTALLCGGLLATVMLLRQFVNLLFDNRDPQWRWRILVTAACLMISMIGVLTGSY